MSLFAGMPMPPPPEFLADRYREATSFARIAWHSPYDPKLAEVAAPHHGADAARLGRGGPARSRWGRLPSWAELHPERRGDHVRRRRAPALHRVAGSGRRRGELHRCGDTGLGGTGSSGPTSDGRPRRSGPDRRRQSGRALDRAVPRLARHSVARPRAPPGDGDPSAGGHVQPADDRDLPRLSGSRRRSSRPPGSSSSRTARSSRSSRSAGRELEYYFRNINEGYESLSPSPRLFITQIGLEPILRRPGRGAGCRARTIRTELVSFEPDDDGVTAVVADGTSGAERTVRARYLIAADGTSSPVRERLGIPLRGHASFSNSITIYFRADVKPSDRRPQPERHLRLRARAAGVLPLLARR